MKSNELRLEKKIIQLRNIKNNIRSISVDTVSDEENRINCLNNEHGFYIFDNHSWFKDNVRLKSCIYFDVEDFLIRKIDKNAFKKCIEYVIENLCVFEKENEKYRYYLNEIENTPYE
jgi:hypothetical protein